MHGLLLLKEREGLLVLGEANSEALLLSFAHLGTAEVKSAAAKLE